MTKTKTIASAALLLLCSCRVNLYKLYDENLRAEAAKIFDFDINSYKESPVNYERDLPNLVLQEDESTFAKVLKPFARMLLEAKIEDREITSLLIRESYQTYNLIEGEDRYLTLLDYAYEFDDVLSFLLHEFEHSTEKSQKLLSKHGISRNRESILAETANLDKDVNLSLDSEAGVLPIEVVRKIVDFKIELIKSGHLTTTEEEIDALETLPLNNESTTLKTIAELKPSIKKEVDRLKAAIRQNYKKID